MVFTILRCDVSVLFCVLICIFKQAALEVRKVLAGNFDWSDAETIA